MDLKQGKGRAAEYALEFRTLAAESGWNERASKALFRQGLNSDFLTEMACHDYQVSLYSPVFIQNHQLHQKAGPTSPEPT